jgi:hypothetical protein
VAARVSNEQRAGSKEQSEDDSKIACLALLIAHFSLLICLGFDICGFMILTMPCWKR